MRFMSITLLLAAVFLAYPVAASEPSERHYIIAQQDGPTLSEAVERVRRQYNGRIVSAETRLRGNREIHYIKVLTEDGKVKTVQIPGRTRGA